MRRRDFLKAIATIAAAASTADVVPLLGAEPVIYQRPKIDWNEWNFVELSHRHGKLVGRINEVDVTRYPELMQRICKFITIDAERASVNFGGVLTHIIPEIDEHAPIIVGARVKFDDDPLRLPTAPEHWFADDLYIVDRELK